MTGIYQMRETFELKEYNTAITRADFEAHFTKTTESVQFTFNGWDGKSYDGESRILEKATGESHPEAEWLVDVLKAAK